MENEENILGKEKIGKLIRKFSIPCIISLLVNSLYNIVDQIFIGWGVGYLGNGATNVVFPLTMICLAFSLMFGDGASAYLSLKLGEKKKEDGGWINAGFMVLEPSIIDLIEGDQTVFEKEPLVEAARMGQLNAYRHKGFWQCMDTLREKNLLEALWQSGQAPWKIWE